MSLVPFVHLDVTLDGAGPGARLPLSREELHHLATVLRLRDGALVEVADGDGRHVRAVLADDHVELRADPIVRPRRSPAIEVAQALPKGRRFDDIVRQLTELDVDAVAPLVTQRCVVRIEATKVERSLERWAAVARAACEQARRSDRPRVGPLLVLEELALRVEADPATAAILAHPGGSPLGAVLARVRAADRVLVVIGPEGGFAPEEVERLVGAGADPVGLGSTVLRTEHAAAAVVAALSYAVGRWG